MNIKFIMRFHDNTPSGGRKIVYEYMNYLVNKGNNISLCFVANTSFKTRKYNHLLYIKYYLDYLKRKKGSISNRLVQIKFKN